jgi:hypothetical protein
MRLDDSHELEIGIEVGWIAHGLAGVTANPSQGPCHSKLDLQKYRDFKGKPL